MLWRDDAAVERLFTLEARRTTAARELGGALATFLTMAYILFANPGILAAAGVPLESAVAATALAAGICSIAMGLVANVPIALAPGMGLNAVVAFQMTAVDRIVAGGDGPSSSKASRFSCWCSPASARAVMAAIPVDLRRAIGRRASGCSSPSSGRQRAARRRAGGHRRRPRA